MKEHLTTMTRKGQITIPVEVRRAMGLRQGDKVAVVIEDGLARLSAVGSVIARTAGAVHSDQPPLSAEQLRDVAEEAIAEEAMERD